MTNLTLVLALALFFLGLGTCTSFVGFQDGQYGTDVFIGIPYAHPPIGTGRLQPPLPLSGDQGIVNATGPNSNRCFELSLGSSSSVGSEDCLTLDIVRPSQSAPPTGNSLRIEVSTTRPHGHIKPLPIYLFIHGYVHILIFH